jgi:hypothetical protein
MKEKHLLIGFVILVVISITFSKGFPQSRVPLPKEIQIKSPSPDLSKEIAAFSGKWGGSWEKRLDFILIVKEIDQEKAEVIYAWGGSRSDYNIFTAKIISGKEPRIEFWSSGMGPQATRTKRFWTFEMQKDLKTLKGTYDSDWGIWKTIAEKID